VGEREAGTGEPVPATPKEGDTEFEGVELPPLSMVRVAPFMVPLNPRLGEVLLLPEALNPPVGVGGVLGLPPPPPLPPPEETVGQPTLPVAGPGDAVSLSPGGEGVVEGVE
jgi:hypothetical protein